VIAVIENPQNMGQRFEVKASSSLYDKAGARTLCGCELFT